ncbi:hypothetical protein [uncultured Veillonella sp.]|uniref:hypothetical protein n=1 Tax=uncultured Veillonella sp. TaxID=159268 RepID=UPI0025954374|nr:hypothetical protein [uncultured Veillonella sp.]
MKNVSTTAVNKNKFTLKVIDGGAVGRENTIAVTAEGVTLAEFLRRVSSYLNALR